MTNGSELKSPGAQALRAAGYRPCPRWWLTEEQLELVAYMARQNQAEVNRIRSEANGRPKRALSREKEIELAWSQQRRGRQ